MEQKDKFEDLKDDIKKFDSFNKDTIKEQYDDLAKKYDDVLIAVEYPDPKKCADLIESLGIAKDAAIFDMGCGTGLVGVYLAEKGYSNIDGVDASPGMLEIAKEKKAYNILEELFLGNSDTFPDKFKDKYQAITCTGVILEGHCGKEIFDEMLMSLNTGGYAVFSTRVDFIDKNCKARMDELVELGKWEFISKEEFTRYENIGEGIGRFKPTFTMITV